MRYISIKKLITNLIVLVCFVNNINAQEVLMKPEGMSLMKQYSSTYPKFYREFQYLRKNESRIKDFKFIRANGNGSPAAASKDGIIYLDVSYLENPKVDFDDNRLIIVLYHELGHLYYFTSNTNYNVEENEKFAFVFSLNRAKELAVIGDCMPLQTGLKFMQMRSLSNDLQDPHVRALKLLIKEPRFKNFQSFAETNCH